MPHFSATIRDGFRELALLHSITKLKTSLPCHIQSNENLFHRMHGKYGVFSPWKAEPGEVLPTLLQAHIFAHHGRQTMSACCFTRSANDPASAICLAYGLNLRPRSRACSSLSNCVFSTSGVRLQKLAEAAPQSAGTVAMDDAHVQAICQRSLVQSSTRSVACFPVMPITLISRLRRLRWIAQSP